MKLAILLTCFNRKEKTLKCIESIYNQIDIPKFKMFICDDNSTDGTFELIKNLYPEIILLRGNGKYFWTKGMYKVMEAAYNEGFEYYLMINDDVEFFDSMWLTVSKAFMENRRIGVVGSTKSHTNQKTSYGGRCIIRVNNNIGMTDLLTPNGNLQKCDLANWNCFLIDNKVISQVGLIEFLYEHGMGDYDYSHKMKTLSIQIYVAQEYVGYCENNTLKNTYRDSNLPARKRIKLILRPNGLPITSWMHYTKKHYGKWWIKYFCGPYIKFCFCVLFRKDF